MTRRSGGMPIMGGRPTWRRHPQCTRASRFPLEVVSSYLLASREGWGAHALYSLSITSGSLKLTILRRMGYIVVD